MKVLETKRLYCRPWETQDLDALTEINLDPEVMRFFPQTYGREKSREFIDRMKKMYNEKLYAYLPCCLKSSDKMIGWVGLCDQDLIGLSMVDIGWRLRRDAWGNGYATELAQAFIEKAFSDYGLNKVYAIATSNNLASIRVMKKIGMNKERAFNHPLLKESPKLEKCELYSIIKH